VVAFLQRLPGMSETTYRELANGNLVRRERGAEDIARTGADSAALTSCIRCHGDATSPPAGRLTPKLTGQSAAYLEAALTDYAHALRPSGIMQPVAGALEPDDIRKLVDYYAGLPHGEPAPAQAADPAQVARGEAIATRGMRESGVPACVTCHVRGSPAVFPRLAGQYAPYVAGQLRLWQRGGRDQTGRGAIMAAIAKRLSGRQIDDVAAYFEQLVPPPPSGAAVGQR
jgi:cytochrome c553